jgi:signal transduction histidine kinase
MQLVYNNFFDEYKKIIDKYRRDGKGKGIRWITSIIDKNNIDLVKIFLNAGIQVRHVKSLTPMNFAVDNKHFYATIEKMEEGKIIESLLASNEPAYVKHFNCIFGELWSKGIDAKDRIADIEKGIEIANVEIIENPKESINRAYDISLSAKEELLVAFPTTNAFRRNVRTGMSMLLLKDGYAKNKVKLRILTPVDNQIMQTIEELKSILPQVDVRATDESIESRITIVLADRKECLIVEIKDDTKDNLYEAAGLSIYSNSNSIVSSYLSIFETLWKQTQLYRQIKEAHEQLKVHDKMQKEFINVAAHELRTPIQPILGLTQILRSEIINNTKQQEFLDAIVRNAKRLQQLTENILDVTKIESHSFQLKKERFNLNEKIGDVINDVNNQTGFRNDNDRTVSILFEPKQDLFVKADKVRMYEVISNLLKNAIKFTKEGTITIAAEKMDYNEAVVGVKDTGKGIDPEIFPRLFTKFATKSFEGTGLGLFISKSIIEAHGGRMWAENNADGKGASFCFSIPLRNRDF